MVHQWKNEHISKKSTMFSYLSDIFGNVEFNKKKGNGLTHVVEGMGQI